MVANCDAINAASGGQTACWVCVARERSSARLAHSSLSPSRSSPLNHLTSPTQVPKWRAGAPLACVRPAAPREPSDLGPLHASRGLHAVTRNLRVWAQCVAEPLPRLFSSLFCEFLKVRRRHRLRRVRVQPSQRVPPRLFSRRLLLPEAVPQVRHRLCVVYATALSAPRCAPVNLPTPPPSSPFNTLPQTMSMTGGIIKARRRWTRMPSKRWG
jgi:hypothetical protein